MEQKLMSRATSPPKKKGFTLDPVKIARAKRVLGTLFTQLSVMIDWSSCPAVERDPDRVSPVAALFENLE